MTLRPADAIIETGTLANTYTPASSDTISRADVGDRGCILEVNNGSGAPINVTVFDPGTTPLGNAGTATAVAVAAGAKKRFKIKPSAVGSGDTARVDFSATASVTCELYRLG